MQFLRPSPPGQRPAPGEHCLKPEFVLLRACPSTATDSVCCGQGQATVYLGQMGGGSHYYVRLRDKVQINAGDEQNWRQRRVRRVLAH
mmetsp:Transcript_39728/g.80044  ORF Transcript_39728/g.80044 Transcript_39728/m.80044 type:complete len:88 (+) Transcript_39728:1067-1330(+)